MITNRYYITTIIAIFLSLSLGILIGGTLGQQWINDNQQKIIIHYETKAERLSKENNELLIKQKELNDNYLQLKDDYKLFFMSSIEKMIDGKKVLWLNDTMQTFMPLKKTIELAGGIVLEHDPTANPVYQISNLPDGDKKSFDYDVVLFFQNNEEGLANYQWLHKYNVPVIYVTNNENGSEKRNPIEIDIYEEIVNLESLNEHYKFVQFLKTLFQENNNG